MPVSAAIQLVAQIGVILLLFEVGLETELAKLLRAGGPASWLLWAEWRCPSPGG